jgi:hypothetical protein
VPGESGLLASAATPAAAQRSETDVFVAQAILAYDARKYDRRSPC